MRRLQVRVRSRWARAESDCLSPPHPPPERPDDNRHPRVKKGELFPSVSLSSLAPTLETRLIDSVRDEMRSGGARGERGRGERSNRKKDDENKTNKQVPRSEEMYV